MHNALLLAGGSSSRMGQDKSALMVEGSTLLDRALALLGQTGAQEVLLSGTVEGHTCIPDINPGSGPPGGLHSALTFLEKEDRLDGSSLLIIPVDMPLLDRASLITLVDSLGDADCCHYTAEVFPCVFKATTKLKNHLDQLFQDCTEPGGARSMKALFNQFNAVEVKRQGLPDELFINLNRPEDLDKYLAVVDGIKE